MVPLRFKTTSRKSTTLTLDRVITFKLICQKSYFQNSFGVFSSWRLLKFLKTTEQSSMYKPMFYKYSSVITNKKLATNSPTYAPSNAHIVTPNKLLTYLVIK